MGILNDALRGYILNWSFGDPNIHPEPAALLIRQPFKDSSNTAWQSHDGVICFAWNPACLQEEKTRQEKSKPRQKHQPPRKSIVTTAVCLTSQGFTSSKRTE